MKYKRLRLTDTKKIEKTRMSRINNISFLASKGENRNVRWNKKGTKIATASDALRIWDIKGNLPTVCMSDDNLWGISWHKKEHRIVTSSKKQKVVIWDIKGRKKQVVKC